MRSCGIMVVISYWVFPLISATVWFSMILSMLVYWLAKDSPHYSYMTSSQHIALISDVGASDIKPWFIVGCVISTIFLDLSLLSERWLRHSGRLVPNTSSKERWLAILSILAAVLGTVGLILLSIFDVAKHHRMHDVFLLLFMVGYVLCAIFICWESQLLGVRFRQFRSLRISFWMKIVVIMLEIGLCIGFGVCEVRSYDNTGAVLEWIIAAVFTIFVLSFLPDLWPAAHTRKGELKEVQMVRRGEPGAV